MRLFEPAASKTASRVLEVRYKSGGRRPRVLLPRSGGVAPVEKRNHRWGRRAEGGESEGGDVPYLSIVCVGVPGAVGRTGSFYGPVFQGPKTNSLSRGRESELEKNTSHRGTPLERERRQKQRRQRRRRSNGPGQSRVATSLPGATVVPASIGRARGRRRKMGGGSMVR